MVVSREDARTAAGIIGNIIALILLLSPLPTFVRIWRKGAVEQYSAVPYLATFVNCGLWVVYGLPIVHPNSALIITINGTGFVIQLIYLLLFLIFSTSKKRLRVFLIILAESAFIGILAVLVLNLAQTIRTRSTIVGSICMVGSVMMYASPLSVMKLVIRSKSVEYMPFFLSLATFANGVCWTSYALISNDPFIAIPNGIGTVLGLAQLILYATYYKSTNRQTAARESNVDISLMEIETKKISNETQNGIYW